MVVSAKSLDESARARKIRALKRALLAATAASIAVSPALGQSVEPASTLVQQQAPRVIDIPPQSLSGALEDLSLNTGLSFAYETSQLDGIESPGASGTLTPYVALDRLLSGTGVTYRKTSGGTVALSLAQSSGAKPSSTAEELSWFAQLVELTSGGNSASQSGLPSASEELFTDPVVVTTPGRRAQDLQDVPRAVQIIDEEELEVANRKSTNLSQTLPEIIPGFGTPVFQNSTRSLSLRGREALLLLDGIPISAGEFGVELGNFDPLTIDRIEVLYGPTALYGDGAAGGVIQFFTREPSEKPVEFRSRIGVRSSAVSGEFLTTEGTSYNVFGEVSGTLDQFDYLASVSFESTNGFFEPDGDRIAPGIRLDDTNDFTFFGKAGFNIDSDQRIQGTINYTRLASNRTDFASIPGNDGNAVATFNPIIYAEEPEQEAIFANLTYEHENLFGGSMRLQGYYRNEELTQIGSDIRGLPLPPFFPVLFQTNFDGDAFGFRGDYTKRFFDRAQLTVGGDYLNESNSLPTFISDPNVFAATGVFDASAVQQQFAPTEIETFGLFAQADFDVTEEITVTGGVRYDRFSFEALPHDPPFGFPPGLRLGGSGSNDGLSFNVGATYQVTDETTLFASFAQGFSLPNITLATNQIPPGTSLSGSAFVEPIEVNSFEGGVRGSLGPLDYQLSGFFAKSENGFAVSVDPASGFGVTTRSPQRNYGVELSTRLNVSDDLRFGFDASFNEGDNDPNDTGDFQPLSSLTVQPIKLAFSADWNPMPDLGLGMSVLYVGNRDRAFDEGVDGAPIDGYATVDLRASYDLGPGTLSLDVLNALNNEYLPLESQTRFGVTNNRRFLAPGRQIGLTYSAEF
ncbi:MAG: TonB-dependent receptor [Pseudomonadota bacterium]